MGRKVNMSGINSTLPLKTINFKSSNTAVSQPVVKQQKKESTLTEKAFGNPMAKVKYVAGAGAVFSLLAGLFVTRNIKVPLMTKLIKSIKLSAEIAIGWPIFYLGAAWVMNFLDTQENKYKKPFDKVDKTLKLGKYRHESIFESKTSQP